VLPEDSFVLRPVFGRVPDPETEDYWEKDERNPECTKRPHLLPPLSAVVFANPRSNASVQSVFSLSGGQDDSCATTTRVRVTA
jgi:hypothetical protein